MPSLQKAFPGVKEKNPAHFILFFFGAVFLVLNWQYLLDYGRIAPPDFYRYQSFAESLLHGQSPEGMIAPPLIPLMIFFFGKFLALFSGTGDPFILAGHIISLVSGILLACFTYRILEKFNPALAMAGVFYLLASPVFLEFIVWPISDLPFLLFVTFYFYSVLNSDRFRSIAGLVLAMMTRFEGVLLILSYLVSFIKIRKRYIALSLGLAVVLAADAFYFAARYSGRILLKIQFLFSKENFLYFFTHPEQFRDLIVRNIFFFTPEKSFPFVADVLFTLFIVSVFSGSVFLYQRKKPFFYSLHIYLLLFIIAKGYVMDSGSGLPHTRRLLSFLFLINLLAVIGAYNILVILKKKIRTRSLIYLIVLGIFVLNIFINRSRIPVYFPVTLAVILITSVWFTLTNWRPVEKILFAAVFTFFVCSVHSTALKHSGIFLNSSQARGGYAIGAWINSARIRDKKIWVFSDKYVIGYICGDVTGLLFDRYPSWKKDISRKEYMAKFAGRVRELGIDYIAYDSSLLIESRSDQRQIKELLLRERKYSDHFKVKKDIIFRGRPAATVLALIKKGRE